MAAGPRSAPEHPCPALVSTEWLAGQSVRVLDASWYLPGSGREPRAEWAAGHIPGAVFFDIEQVVEPNTTLPHMAPPAEVFREYVQALGIRDQERIVIYDSHGIFSAPRAWWLFRLFGIDLVSVLDGGLKKWRAEGRELRAGEEAAEASGAAPHIARNVRWVRQADDVAEAGQSGSAQIVDARPSARFRGKEAEPRPGLRAGSIPSSRNIPYQSLLEENGCLKDQQALRRVFSRAGIDLTRPVITSCGSGVTAAIINLALEQLGHREHSLYDGSWAEWGASARPIS